jgi:hypothetical protein
MDIIDISMDRNTLFQRLQSAEKSIAFIQREHASTLGNLHEEIVKWQQKCSGQYELKLLFLQFNSSIFRTDFSISHWRRYYSQFL